MTVAIATTGAEVERIPIPRATVSASPLARAIGWLMVDHHGRWAGTVGELRTALRPHLPPLDQALMGGGLTPFAKRFAAELAALRLAGLSLDLRRERVAGRRLRRWHIASPEILAAVERRPPPAGFAAFVAERIETTEFDTVTTVADAWRAYGEWAGDTPSRIVTLTRFGRLLAEEARARGACRVEVVVAEGRYGPAWKGIGLRRPAAEATAEVATSEPTIEPTDAVVAVDLSGSVLRLGAMSSRPAMSAGPKAPNDGPQMPPSYDWRAVAVAAALGLGTVVAMIATAFVRVPH